MWYRSCRRSDSSVSSSFTAHKQTARQAAVALAILLGLLPCLAQDQTQTQPSNQQPGQAQATITIPAGTRMAMVLTQPVQSRYVHRGDDVFAQVLSPVDAGNQVVIPAGTFVQGSVDKLGRSGTQGELRLESLSITFPDGYVAPIAGPITLHSDQGYALKDPGKGRFVGAFMLPAAGAGIGALIGHSVGSSQSTLTTTLPPGCTGPPPYCLTSSMTVPGSAGKDTAIGAGVGAAIGMVASMALLFSSHHFYLVAGAPIQMTLQQAVTLRQDEVAKAVRESEQHPVSVQPVAPLPLYPPYPPPYSPTYPNMPYQNMDQSMPPPAPAAPPTVIPGPPGPGGIPGAPIIIPGPGV